MLLVTILILTTLDKFLRYEGLSEIRTVTSYVAGSGVYPAQTGRYNGGNVLPFRLPIPPAKKVLFAPITQKAKIYGIDERKGKKTARD
jgi:hypothetical protein